MIFRSIFFLLFFSIAPAYAEIKLSSSASVAIGGDQEGSRFRALDLNLTLPLNWQFKAGFDSSQIPNSKDSGIENLAGGYFGVGSNPLRLWSGDIEVGGWRMGDDIKAQSFLAMITFIPSVWTFQIAFEHETLEFANLPKLIFTNGKSEVSHDRAQLAVEAYMLDHWNLRGFYSRHQYDQNLEEYAEGLRVIRIPPTVLTTVTSFSSHEGGLELTRYFDKANLSLQLGHATSALDGVKSKQIQVRGSYQLSPSWKIGGAIGTSRPTDSNEDSSSNSFGRAILTFLWN